MTEAESCQRLRDELKAIRTELQELLDVLSNGEASAEARAARPCVPQKLDFFDQIKESDQLVESEELYRKVLNIITTKGYASTLMLQHKLEINPRQAFNIIAELERKGIVGPAHGFRPHKVLPAAYALCERIERGLKD
jgi:DNA segregation ATPase FtsK/SpoIIIE-like protein